MSGELSGEMSDTSGLTWANRAMTSAWSDSRKVYVARRRGDVPDDSDRSNAAATDEATSRRRRETEAAPTVVRKRQ